MFIIRVLKKYYSTFMTVNKIILRKVYNLIIIQSYPNQNKKWRFCLKKEFCGVLSIPHKFATVPKLSIR